MLKKSLKDLVHQNKPYVTLLELDATEQPLIQQGFAELLKHIIHNTNLFEEKIQNTTK